MNENVKINSINNYLTIYYLKSEDNYKELESVFEKKKNILFTKRF